MEGKEIKGEEKVRKRKYLEMDRGEDLGVLKEEVRMKDSRRRGT